MFYTPLFFPSSLQPAFLFLELFCNLTRFLPFNLSYFSFYSSIWDLFLFLSSTCFNMFYLHNHTKPTPCACGRNGGCEEKAGLFFFSFFRSSGYSHFYQVPILLLHLPRCPPDIIQSNAGVGNKVLFFLFFSTALDFL